MLRKLLALWMALAPLVAQSAQNEVIFFDVTGQNRYARFNDPGNTAVNMAEGTGLQTGRYIATKAAIQATNSNAGIPAGEYTVRIFAGTAGAQSGSDQQVGYQEKFQWNLDPTPFRQYFSYDGGLEGNMRGTFTRNAVTVDGAGLPVAANERRYDGVLRSVAGLCNFHVTNYVLSSTAYLMASGEDLNGDPLVVIRDDSSSTIRVVEIDDERLIPAEQSRTAWTALPGAGGTPTIAYTPRSAQVIHGTIIVQCMRYSGSTITGMALAYSQDRGATWGLVNTAAIDGGGDYMPKPASYGTTADSNIRGGIWSTTYCYDGGLDAEGRPYSTNVVWVPNWDYLVGTGGQARGFDGGVVKLYRDSDDVHYTIGTNRRLLSDYSASYVTNLHIHTIGMTGGGVFIAAMGDTNGKSHIRALELDLDDYETDPTITNNVIFGEYAPTTTVGRMAPQIFGGAMGPDGSILWVNDTWHSPMMFTPNMTSVSSTFALDSHLYVVGDESTGNFYRGWENFNVRYFPGKGWVTGPDGALVNPKNCLRYFSRDGRNWAMLNNTDGMRDQQLIAGDCLAVMGSSSLYLCKLPEVRTMRPLMLAPALDNYLHNTNNLYQAVAPSSTNTLERVLYSGGRYIFQDDSTPVPNAPKFPPPFYDPVIYYLGNESSSNYEHGWVYLPDTADTATIGANYVGVTAAVANLGSAATGWFTGRVGSDGISNNCTSFQGFKPDRTATAENPWCYAPIFGNPVNDPTSSRTLMQLLSGPSSGTANKDCPQLVAVGGLHVTSSGITPWSTPRDSTGNPNEYESFLVQASPNDSQTWTFSFAEIRSDVQATLGSVMPNGPLAVVKRDAYNNLAINMDGTNWEIDVVSTVNNSTADSDSIAIEDQLRGSPLLISASDNGKDIVIVITSPRNGSQTITLTDASIGYPTQVLFSNLAQTSVYNYMIAGGELWDQALTYQQIVDEHISLSFLDTEADKTAATVAQQVDEQLEYAFAGVPASVWLQQMSQIQASDSAGVTLSEKASAESLQEARNDIIGDVSEVQVDTDEIRGRLPDDDRKMAAAGDEAVTLDDVEGGSSDPISPLFVNDARKWKPNSLDSSQAGNIVTVNAGFSKTLAMEMPLNPEADIATVESVTITGPAAVTATNMRKAADGTEAHFDTADPVTTKGNYTVEVTVTTVDDQELSMRGRLVVK